MSLGEILAALKSAGILLTSAGSGPVVFSGVSLIFMSWESGIVLCPQLYGWFLVVSE